MRNAAEMSKEVARVKFFGALVRYMAGVKDAPQPEILDNHELMRTIISNMLADHYASKNQKLKFAAAERLVKFLDYNKILINEGICKFLLQGVCDLDNIASAKNANPQAINGLRIFWYLAAVKRLLMPKQNVAPLTAFGMHPRPEDKKTFEAAGPMFSFAPNASNSVVSDAAWQDFRANVKRTVDAVNNTISSAPYAVKTAHFGLDDSQDNKLEIFDNANHENKIVIERTAASITSTFPAAWFNPVDGAASSAECQLIISFIEALKGLPAGYTVTLGNCKTQPQVAVYLHRLARDEGVNVEYSTTDGTKDAVEKYILNKSRIKSKM